MASAQVSRYNATQRNKLKFHTISLKNEEYNRVTEKSRETGYPRTAILEYLIDQYLDKVRLD